MSELLSEWLSESGESELCDWEWELVKKGGNVRLVNEWKKDWVKKGVSSHHNLTHCPLKDVAVILKM